MDGEQDMGSDERVLDGGTRVGGRGRRVLHRDPEREQRPVGRPGRGTGLGGLPRRRHLRRQQAHLATKLPPPAHKPAGNGAGGTQHGWMSSFAGTFTGAHTPAASWPRLYARG